MEDKVNKPSHYQGVGTCPECGHSLEAIAVTAEYDFCIGNALKYTMRAGKKSESGYDAREKEIEDLQKAIWYLNYKIKSLQKLQCDV